jgi:hypothetical protein
MSGDRTVLLNTLAFTAVRLAAEDFDAFIARLQQALAPAADDDHPRLAAAQRLQQQPTVFHGLLRDALQQSLLDACASVAVHGKAALKSGALDLSLQTFDAMQRKVQIDNLSQALDKAHADQLAILGMRINNLLYPDQLRAAPNPFRAESFLFALADAWSRFERDPATLPLVLEQIRPAVFLPLDKLYQALNQELRARGVMPDAEQQYWNDIPELSLAVTPSLRDRLQAWLAPEGTLKLITVRAVQLLTALFEHLSNDERLAFRARKAVAQLAVPLQPLLQNDSGFFFGAAHPVRELLRAIFDAGLAAGDGNDALSHAIADIPARLATAAGPAQLAEELRDALARQDRAHVGLLDAHKREALRQDAGAAAQRQAQEELATRLETGEVDSLLESFLQTQWLEVLAFACRVRDSKPELLPSVLQVMDDLIWSVRIKPDAAERRRLVERLPTLLSTLNAWLNVIKWEGAERDSFFAALAEAHAAALRPPMNARHELEMRMASVQKASEHQLARRADEQQQEADAAYLPAVEALQPGSWVELVRNNGTKVNCRLGWTSPARSRLVFVVPQTRLVFTLRTDELARALRAGRATLIDVDAWVDAGFAAALDKLRG